MTPCPGAAGTGELTLGELQLTIAPLSASATLVLTDLQLDVRPLNLAEPETRERRLRQAQRAGWVLRHLLLDAATVRHLWRRQAAVRVARRLGETEAESEESSEEEESENDRWNDEEEDESGSGVSLLRPRRDLDVAPPVRRGWLSYMVRAAATRYALGILDRTEVLLQNVSVRVHSSADGTERSVAEREQGEEAEIITVRLHKLSLGQAPHTADRLADDRVVRDPPTAVPTHEATLGRRSAWVRRDPLSPELTLSALPMRSVWMRKAKAAVSPTISLSLLKERLERWFPAAAADRRVGDQQPSPVAVCADGPVSLLPSIHTLSAVGLTVQCERGSREQSCTVLEQKMLRVDIAACVDERCWMRALDFIVLDAVNIAVTPLEANAALAPIVRAFAAGKSALRYAHHRLPSPPSLPPPQPRRTPAPAPSSERRTRSVQLWQFACRCVQQELRRVRPSAAVRWSKLAVMFDYQKQWLRFIAQAHRIGPSGRPMLQLIMSLARETLASIAMPVADYDQQREGINGHSRPQVLVSREHADQWAKWVRNRRSHEASLAGRSSVASQVTEIVAADLAAVPEPSIRLWARRRHLILTTVELVMLETQPAAIGDGAADGGGYMLSTDEIIAVRERAMLDHPLDPDYPDWATSMSAPASMTEPEGCDGDSVNDIANVAAAMGTPPDLPAACVVSLILRELHVSLHPGPADRAAAAGPDSVAGVFCRIGEVGMASRVTANYDAHEIELAVGHVNAVQNISIHSYRRDHSLNPGLHSPDMLQDFLSSAASSQSFVLMRSSLDAESRRAHTAIRVSRLTLTAHLPAIEELARVAERSAVEMFSTRADASRRLDQYALLLQPQASTTAASNGGSMGFALSRAAAQATELMTKFMVAVPSMLSSSESANSWLIPATDQAGIYLLHSRCCSHSIEVDIDGPALSITQGQAACAPQLAVWSGMLEASYATSGTPSAAAFRGGAAEAETSRAAFSDALSKTAALRVRKRQHEYARGHSEHADGGTHIHGEADGLLFGNADACWSGFLVSLTHTLDGVPTVIRFNQQFKWRAHLSSCVLPRQFSALCGMPVTTLKCDLDRVDFKAAPPDLVCVHGLLDRFSGALQTIAARFWPVMAQDPQSFYEGLRGGGALGGEYEIPDDIDLQRSDAAQPIGNATATAETPKADIPGPYVKPRSNRPSHAVRWDGSKGDWLDDDGHVALPAPMDDSEFCNELMYDLAAVGGSAGRCGALGRVAGHRLGPGHIGAGESLVDQPMLEVVLDTQPITFTLQQNRGRPLLLVALHWDNVHILQLGDAVDRHAAALDISADMTLHAHFDNAHLARWEPVVEPWRSKVRLEVSRQRALLSLHSERCLDINLSPAFLQGLWFSMNESATGATPSKPFDHVNIGTTAPVRYDVATAKAQGQIPAREAMSDLNASPYWLRNSCGSSIEVRLRAGRDESGPAYLLVANQERVALDADDYGAPALVITAAGMRLEGVGGCDLHVRFQYEGEQIEYVFEDVNRVDTHQPKGELAGRPDVICYVHINPEGRKVCEVCSRLRIQNRTRGPLEFGFCESTTTVVVKEGETGYAPPQYCYAAADSVFVRPNRDFEWAEMCLAGQEVHRGVARCRRIRSGGVQQQQRQQLVYGMGFTACFSCALLDEQFPVNVLTLFDALTLRNMIPSTVTVDVFSSSGETSAETSVSLDFGETYVVPNWLPTQPAWLAVTDCRGATSHRTLIHEAEIDKSWAKFGTTPQHELGHVGTAKRKVGALKLTENVETSLRLRGGAFAVKHVSNGKLTATDHFDIAVHHTDLVDAGHTVTLHVGHCVINRTEYPLYMKTDSKGSFVVMPAWTQPSIAESMPRQEDPIILPCSPQTKSRSPFGGGSSLESVNVRFGCPVHQVSLEDSSHRFVLLGAAFKRNTDAFGSDDLSSYAKVVWDSRVIGETEEVRSTRFPVWNKSMPINLSGRPAPMTVAVYDRRKIVADHLLGEALIPIEELRSKMDHDIILPLFTPAGRRKAEAAEAKRARAKSEQEQGRGDVRIDLSGVWRATSADQRTTEHILLREGRKAELTGGHVCGIGDAFVIQAGRHDHERNEGMEITFEQVYEQDGARIDWVGTLTSPDTMVGTWHGTGIHGSFDAVRLPELDYADLAVGFLTLRLEEFGAVGAAGTNQHHDDVHHFVGNWSDELPLSHDLAVGAGLPPITIDAGRQGKRQLGIYVEPPAMPLAPMVIAIVPRFVFYNCSGTALMLVDVDSTWMATIESGEHCEGFTAPRQALNSPEYVPHRLAVRKLRSAGIFVDSEIIDVEEPGVKWGIFPSPLYRQAEHEDREEAMDMLTHLADDIHAHCQLDGQGTMVITLRKAADVEPPYHIINLSTVELEYRPKLEAATADLQPSAADAEVETPRYRKLGVNKTAALHEHLWPRNRSQTRAGEKVHRLEVRIGGEAGETRVFSLDNVNDRCPKWEIAVPTGVPGAGVGGRIRLRPQVLVDRQGLSLRFSTTRVGSRWIDRHASKIDVQMLGGISVSIISAQQSRGQQQPPRQELMYGRLHGIHYTSYISDGLRTVELIVAKMQLDDQISQQVVLRPRLSSTDRQLHFCMVRSSPSTIDRVDLSILPFVFTLKYPTAKRMFLWWKNIFDDSGDNLCPHSKLLHTANGRLQARAQAQQVLSQLRDPSYKACMPSVSSTSDEERGDAELSSSRNGGSSLMLRRVYIKSLRLRHVKLECTIDMVGAVRDPMASELLPFMFGIGTGSFSAMARFTFGLATKANSVNRMRLNIDEFERRHWFDTSDSAFATMHNHYSEQTMRQLCSLRGLASLDIFGAPLTKVKIVSESAHEGWLAVRDRDGIGMALSGVNMGKELIANTLSTASTMTQAFSGTVKNVIGDEVAMDRPATPTAGAAIVGGARDGMAQGGKLLSEGLLDAVTGVVEKPLEGLQQGGGAGLVRGTGEGLLGLVLKPVAAISDFVSASTEGLAQTLDSNQLTDDAPPWAHRPGGVRAGRTMRSARSFGQYGELSEFSTGDVMLRKLADRRSRSVRSMPTSRHPRHLPGGGRPIRGEGERCVEMLVETMASPRQEDGQLFATVAMTLLTDCSLVHMITVEAAGPLVERALQLQSRPHFGFATVISEAELSALIHTTGAQHWEIVEDRSLEEIFSVSFDAIDQKVTLLMGPPWGRHSFGHTAYHSQEGRLRLGRSPRIVDDTTLVAESAAGSSRGGVRELLGFMDCVVKATSHHQRQTHTLALVDITNADVADEAAAFDIDASTAARKVDDTRWQQAYRADSGPEGVATKHGWLLLVHLTELDHGGAFSQQPRGGQVPSCWRYSLELYSAQDGVLGSVAGLTASDSAAIEMQGHHEHCRLRVCRYHFTSATAGVQQHAEHNSAVTVLDAGLPRVGVGAGWSRDWCIEDLNNVNLDIAGVSYAHDHVYRSRHGEQQQQEQVIDLTSPKPFRGGGGVSCLSAGGDSVNNAHRQSGERGTDTLVDLIVEVDAHHRLLHWSLPGRGGPGASAQHSRHSHRNVRADRQYATEPATVPRHGYGADRQQHKRSQLTPVLDRSREVIDLASEEDPTIYCSDIEEAEAMETREAEMAVAATEGDVESLARLTAQDPAMLHARLPLQQRDRERQRESSAFKPDGDGTATALWLAAWNGHAEAVRWLLERGADGSSSYHCTARTDRGADHSGCTALHVACIEGHAAVVPTPLTSFFGHSSILYRNPVLCWLLITVRFYRNRCGRCSVIRV